MPKNCTYRVAFKGQEFTRTSARTYTHVVLVREDPDRCLQRDIGYARELLEGNWDFHCRVAAGSAPGLQFRSPEDWKESCRVAALGKDAALQDAEDQVRQRVLARVRAGAFDRFAAVGWCGRGDLAAKLAAQQRQPLYCNAEVVIVEVPQPAERAVPASPQGGAAVGSSRPHIERPGS